jgi:putative sterol carrier protein
MIGGESTPIEAERYAALARDLSDEDLAAGLEANREQFLAEIFRLMPARFDPGAAGDLEVVLEWRITGASGGGFDRWQVVIADGACEVVRDGGAEPSATITLGPTEFVKLVTGAVAGPELFISGGLEVEGDLLLAAQTNTVFRIPGAEGSAPG